MTYSQEELAKCDNGAVLAGFTDEMHIEIGGSNLALLVKPDTDIGDTFRAWCMDEQEYLNIQGWLIDEVTYSQGSIPTIERA